MTKLTLSEAGNGFSGTDEGDTVYCSEDGNLYRLTWVAGNIQTGSPGQSNFIFAEGKSLGDATDLSEAEFERVCNVSVSLR